jgi:hypothetical protein
MKDIPAFAFPIHPDVDLSRDQIWGGMTLRDYFAAKAMQELIGVLNFTDGTRKAYEWADAMMKAREE